MSRKSGCLAITILGLVLATAVALGLWVMVHRDQTAVIGEEIMYDDFGFRVKSVRNVEGIGVPGGRMYCTDDWIFFVVRFEVENHARRTEYEMSSHRPVVEDDEGWAFEVDEKATSALAAESKAVPVPEKLRAGGLTSSDLVYRIPKASQGLRLRVKWSAEPIEGLDVAIFGDRAIVLGR